MRLMLASFDSDVRAIPLEELKLCKYALMSFFYLEKSAEEKAFEILQKLNKEDRFILDSGAFTLFTSKKLNIDFDAYLDRYINFINKYDIKRFIELDIDAVVGYKKVLKMRKKLEEKTGKKCMPVWHLSRGIKAYKEIVRDYEYICIGGLGNKEIKPVDYGKVKQMVNYANANGTKVHGLAFTRKDAHEYGFYSVDSSAWKMGIRFGQAHKFINGKIVSQTRKNGQRADADKIAINNFYEWIKFQKYVDKKGVSR